jgi:hypothetical protein
MWKKEEDSVSPQPASTTMAMYSEAVDRFTKSATAFMEQMHHPTQAHTAYQEALAASADLRKVLDAGDETLRNLMTQLEHTVNVHLGKPGPVFDKKQPEPVKVEAIRGNGESTAVWKAFP